MKKIIILTLLTIMGFNFSLNAQESISYIKDTSSWFYIYDMYGKKINVLSNSYGRIVSVSANTFTMDKGSWLHIYSREGKKIKTMSK
ncbi:MAG: hypothetical protein IKA83_07845 [Paludibacteraceae bacterium]|nr:hypothetical protein [Paludibacteraceae bacterium]